jgi:hypothetical protein
MSEREMTGQRTYTNAAALFTDRMDAERAINDLHAAGFTNAQVGVALRDRTEQGALVEDSGANPVEGAVSGAVGGGLLGGLTGFLAGLVAAILIPGVGPIVVGGTLASALAAAGGTAMAGAGIGAATGGILGALAGMGFTDEEARYFDTGFRSGGTLVTVQAGSRADEAKRILQRHGGDTGSSAAQSTLR